MAERVAFFLPGLFGGGAERVVLTLAQELRDAGVDVELVVAQREGELAERLPADVRVTDLRASRSFAATLPLARRLRAAPPDALLSTLEHANVVASWAHALARSRSRLVLRAANTMTPDAQGAAHFRGRLTPALARVSFRRADALVANSCGSAADLESHLGLAPGTVRVIPNPLPRDIERLAREPSGHAWLDAPEAPVAVAAGRLCLQKDFSTLLLAFALASPDGPERLVILGDGPDRGRLVTLARELGVAERVDLPGYVTNPYAHYARATVFALSSRWEGSPNALIEALACGAPAVATDCPSGPRELLAGGRHGVLVPVGDWRALADALGHGFAGKLPRPTPDATAPHNPDRVVAAYRDVLLPPRGA
jgi:glycosyltransferase involved in cell wall biosynthesis